MFINLTPHTLTIYSEDKKTVLQEIESSGTVRLQEKRIEREKVYNYPVSKIQFESPIIQFNEDLKPVNNWNPDQNVVLVVSAIAGIEVKKMFPENIVLSPDTSLGAVRNEKNQIIGTTGFIEY